MKCRSTIYLKKYRVEVPCGKCVACRKRKASEWVTRLNEEYKASQSAYFVTLTYDDAFLPKTAFGEPTLDKNHLKEFLNILRQYAPYRYFSIGEYGDKGERPHYHLIIFNFSPIVNPDTRNIVYRKDWDKITSRMLISNVDTEAIIYKAWQKKGIVQVQPLEGGAINYLANYLVDTTVRPEGSEQQKIFALMSRKPAIGHQYYDNKEVFNYHRKGTLEERLNKIKYTASYGETLLPRLYRNKLYTKNEQKKYSERLLDKDYKLMEKVVKAKKLDLFIKNTNESYEHREDVARQRNPKRSI